MDKIIYDTITEKYESVTIPNAEVITFNETIKFIK